MKLTYCPIPHRELAHNVDELVQKQEEDSFQEEYGIRWEEWLSENWKLVEDKVDKWFSELTYEQQCSRVYAYRGEIVAELKRLDTAIKQMDKPC